MLFKLYLVDFALVIAEKAAELSVGIIMTQSFLSIIMSANQIVISSFVLLENPLMFVIEMLKIPLYGLLLIRNPHPTLEASETMDMSVNSMPSL